VLARFRVLLPFTFQLDSAGQFHPEEWQEGESTFRVHPPAHSSLSPGGGALDTDDPAAVVAALEGPLTQKEGPLQFVNGGRGMQGDVLQIDLWRTDFDRRRTNELAPVVDLFFGVANGLLERLRLITRLPWLARLDRHRCFWLVDYLSDDGAPLEPAPELLRAVRCAPLSFKMIAITESLWQRALALPRGQGRARPLTLWLDGAKLLPEIGPSLVLAAAAIETRTEDILHELAAASPVPPGLWSWLMDRGDFRKDPSTVEQLTVVLHSLTGRSLKDEGELWEAFINLRDARNSYLHEGLATVGKNRTPVAPEFAAKLVHQCERILEWLDGLVPEDRRVVPSREPVEWVRAWGLGDLPSDALISVG
jgi:hypothetical protein